MGVRVVISGMVVALWAQSASAVFQQGVDVYSGQASVSWTSMKSGGISFAFVKATEGQNFIDTQFATNMTNAKAAGVIIGPYHFARPDSNNTDPNDAANEANDFVDAIAPYYSGPNLTLRPVLDLENLAGVGTTAQEKTFLSQWVRNFAAVVHTRLSTDIMIYVNRNFAQNYLASDLAQYPLWVAKPISTTASATTQNDFSQASAPLNSELGIWSTAGYKFWQWSWGGSVGGENPVDRDAFNGTMQQLSAYIPDFQAGDLDANGVVDARDYVKWRKTLNQTVKPGTGADADLSGVVDTADFNLWRTNFAKTFVYGAGSGLSTLGVPEAGTVSLILIAAFGLLGRRGKRRQLR